MQLITLGSRRSCGDLIVVCRDVAKSIVDASETQSIETLPQTSLLISDLVFTPIRELRIGKGCNTINPYIFAFGTFHVRKVLLGTEAVPSRLEVFYYTRIGKIVPDCLCVVNHYLCCREANEFS